MKKNCKRHLLAGCIKHFCVTGTNHKLWTRLSQALKHKQNLKQRAISQKKIITDGKVMVVELRTLEGLELTTMATLERVSQIIEQIHSHKTKKENFTEQDNQVVDLEEELLQIAHVFNKVADQIEHDWQDSSTEDHELYNQVYNDLNVLVQVIKQKRELLGSSTDSSKILCSSTQRLLNTLADAIEFESISSEVSNILSIPFPENEVKRADAAIARLTAQVNSQEYSPEEIWTRFDAVRDKITSNTKPQN
jgi:hypothetical protein